jgi:hypothetical protein
VTRKIRDTDILYSAVTQNGTHVRFSLKPCLDSENIGDRMVTGGNFGGRAIYSHCYSMGFSASCRSRDCHYSSASGWSGPWLTSWGGQRQWSHEGDDDWLDWLAEDR